MTSMHDRLTYHVAIDIGGTFTDCAMMDQHGQVVCIAKSPSTRADPSDGVLGALGVAAEQVGASLEQLLASTRLLIHGCTVATNAMIQRTGAPTGLITTRGHEDAILIGKVIQKVAGLSEREIIHQSRLSKARPVVDPEHIHGVRERIDAEGEIIAPLALADVEAAADQMRAQGVQAVAVSFLWSFLNNSHERAAKDLLRQRHPELYVQASSDVAPVLGEYERTVTTVLSAFLGPPVVHYLERLAQRLRTAGYQHELLVSHCMGGLTTVDEVRDRPLLTLDSGPAGGVLGARYFGALYGEPNVLCTDMGGTSFDVSLIERGEFALDEEPVIDQYTFLVPKIAIASIGAGGGSLVWVDPDGILRVGPQSAGADPGPACYGRGGQEPTVTDVNVVLGYINPTNFLGGRHTLRAELATEAVDRVARRAGMDSLAVASGAFQIVNAQMADLIRKTTVEKGYDPREFALFAYGGAAPTHAAYYARELRLKRIYVPRHSTVFSALGMLTGGIVHTAEASFPALVPLAVDGRAHLRELFATLEGRVTGQFEREGYPEGIPLRRYLYMKYRLQPRALPIELEDGTLTDETLESLVNRFEARYAEIYGQGAGYRQAGIELVKVRVDGALNTISPAIAPAQVPVAPDASQAVVAERSVFFVESEAFVPTRIHDGDRLQYGNVLEGPAVVERMGDTILIPPGVRGEIDRFQNLILHVDAAPTHQRAHAFVSGGRA
jgi:N-methylhydantoinase A